MNKRIKKKLKKRYGFKTFKSYREFFRNVPLKHYLPGGKEPIYESNNLIKFSPKALKNFDTSIIIHYDIEYTNPIIPPYAHTFLGLRRDPNITDLEIEEFEMMKEINNE